MTQTNSEAERPPAANGCLSFLLSLGILLAGCILTGLSYVQAGAVDGRLALAALGLGSLPVVSGPLKNLYNKLPIDQSAAGWLSLGLIMLLVNLLILNETDRVKMVSQVLTNLTSGVFLGAGIKLIVDRQSQRLALRKELIQSYNDAKKILRELKAISDGPKRRDVLARLNGPQLQIETIARLVHGKRSKNDNALRRMEEMLRNETRKLETEGLELEPVLEAKSLGRFLEDSIREIEAG